MSELTAQLGRYQGFNDRYLRQGAVQFQTDFTEKGKLWAEQGKLGENSLRARLHQFVAEVLDASVGILYQFTPYQTGEMQASTAGVAKESGTFATITIGQDRMNTQQTAQVPPLVIAGHMTRPIKSHASHGSTGGPHMVPANPYNERAMAFIAPVVDEVSARLSVMIANDFTSLFGKQGQGYVGGISL